MNLRVVYCNHTTAGLSVRERLAFASSEQLLRAYGELRSRFPAAEHVILSTCNRVEVYSAQEEAEAIPSRRELAEFLAEFHQLPLDEFLGDLLERTGAGAIQHLFEVACSVDSLVLGESQIVNQVKEAYDLAVRGQAQGRLTNALFQRALQVSRRVRTQTRLVEGRISIASVAVGQFGKQIFDRFDNKAILVIGAGEMAEETLRYLQGDGARRITVCNRSLEHGQQLASRFGGVAAPFDQLDRLLGESDLVISTTGADRPIVDADRMRAIRRRWGVRPLLILDLAAPRDFHPDARQVDEEIYLYDIDDLEATCQRNREARSRELEQAKLIIAEETQRFLHDLHHQASGPVIMRLREDWHRISRQELQSLFQSLPHLSAEDRTQVERSIERIVNRLLHPPLETLRDAAKTGPPHGLLDAIRRLFHLKSDEG